MAPRKPTKSSAAPKKNPRHRVYLPQGPRGVGDPKPAQTQRALFEYTHVYPGDARFPTGRVADQTQQLMSPPDDAARAAGNWPEEKFVYSEDYPDPPFGEHKHQRFGPKGERRGMEHELTEGRQGLLFGDVGALQGELDELAGAIVDALVAWAADRQAQGAPADYMEQQFEQDLNSLDVADIILPPEEAGVTLAPPYPALATLLEQFPVEVMDEVRSNLNDDSSLWWFHNGAPPTTQDDDGRHVDWDHVDDEFHIQKDGHALVIAEHEGMYQRGDAYFETAREIRRRFVARGQRFPTVDDAIDRAREIYQELEADEGYGDVAVEEWLKAIVARSGIRYGKVAYDGAQLTPHLIKTYGAYRTKKPGEWYTKTSEFSGHITVQAWARLREERVEAVLERLADELLEDDEAERDPDENEQEREAQEEANRPRMQRERIAQITDATTRLPYVFDPEAAGVLGITTTATNETFLVGTDWSVWNLSSADLDSEGDAAGHCVAGANYGPGVRSGDFFIWSVKDGAMKTKFTLQVARTQVFGTEEDADGSLHQKMDDAIAGFTQVKGKANRLPGWEFKWMYDPYAGAFSYHPHVKPYATRSGKLLPGVTVEDVRADEVRLLWQLIMQVVSLEDLMETNKALWEAERFGTWDAVIAALISTEQQTRMEALYTLRKFCPDMIPGLVAVFTGTLFNAPPGYQPEPRTNPSRGRGGARARPPAPLRARLKPSQFAVPAGARWSTEEPS